MTAKILTLLAILISAGVITSSTLTNEQVFDDDWFESYESTSENITGTELLLADTRELQIRGLSNTPFLPKGVGMLFIFDNENNHGIWMKDMNYSIDVVWLNDEKEVIYVIDDMAPESYPTVYEPKTKSLYIIEFNDQFFEQNNLSVGDKLEFNVK